MVLSTVKRTESDLHQIEQGELIVMSAKTNHLSLDTVGSGMLPIHTDSVSCFKKEVIVCGLKRVALRICKDASTCLITLYTQT